MTRARSGQAPLLAAVAAATALLLGCTYEVKQSQALYQQHCSSCHDSGANALAPNAQALRALPSAAILASLESGKMQAQGAALRPRERRLLAMYLGAATGATAETRCLKRPRAVSPVYWSGFSPDPRNHRRQTPERAGFSPEALRDLELAWAFALPNATDVRTQPAVLGDLVVMGTSDGQVFGLDRDTGCVAWRHRGDAQPRTPFLVGSADDGATIYYGDFSAHIVALDAATGELRWRARVHDHRFAMLTGAPRLEQGVLYVPVSSYEVAVAMDRGYECCTFRGAVVALTAETGELIWTTSMGDPATPRKGGRRGRTQNGPSGAPVWTSPAIDLKRGVLYVGTGENYSSPADGWSDAIVALELETGRVRWRRQTTGDDAFTMACYMPAHPNCPDEDGPDFDFGASPVLVTTVDGRDLILAAQKSGIVHALDPDGEGAIVWQQRVGRGGTLGGVHWGITVAGAFAFIPVSDRADGRSYPDRARPGIAALDLESGAIRWQKDIEADCPRGATSCMIGLSAPASSLGDYILTGGLDGHLRIFHADDGALVFDYDTRKRLPASRSKVRGGAIDAAGPVAAGGLVLVPSGYAQHGQTPGNALFAFRPRGGPPPQASHAP